MLVFVFEVIAWYFQSMYYAVAKVVRLPAPFRFVLFLRD